jgi:ferric-dicitrate binding protein FerR (iron transport regulator)
MTTVRKEPESADASIEQLLREVGARDEPSPDVMREVQSAVHAEWQAMVGERRRQRRAMAWRVAASMVIAVLIATFAYRYTMPVPVQVAKISNIDGQLLAATGTDNATALTVDQPVMVGAALHTDDSSRAAMQLDNGLSVRLDHNTSIMLAATDRIVLTSGALYVDSSSIAASKAPLVIETHAGSVQHVGTQYEVRTHADSIVVSVREGRVVLNGASGQNTAEAGQVLRLSANGELTRDAISPADPRWQWALDAAPVFDINNQTLAAFLQWIARETGKRLVYSSSAAQTAATQAKLHGSIAGLDADSALAAVLSSTNLRRYATTDGEIGIELADRGPGNR